jgi:hypothetical protein
MPNNGGLSAAVPRGHDAVNQLRNDFTRHLAGLFGFGAFY